MTRVRLLRAFLWLSVLAWGIGAGAKLYDLVVVSTVETQPELQPALLSLSAMISQYFTRTISDNLSEWSRNHDHAGDFKEC
jgi:hypothetical protein